MMKKALEKVGLSNSEAAMIGDRMETDIIGGLESEIDPILVLSGVTKEKDLVEYSYSPFIVLNEIGELAPDTSTTVTNEEEEENEVSQA